MQLLKLKEENDIPIKKILINNEKKSKRYSLNTIKEYKMIDVKKIDKLYLNFDNHYIMFITYRQQRDNIIFNEAIKNILKLSVIDKNIKKKLYLSDYFKIKKDNTLEISENIIPIDKKSITTRIEQEIKILKTYNLLFCNLTRYLKLDNNIFIKSLPVKLKKIKNLNDISFLSRITNSAIVGNNILSNVPKLKSFDSIKEDYIFYSKIFNEILL